MPTSEQTTQLVIAGIAVIAAPVSAFMHWVMNWGTRKREHAQTSVTAAETAVNTMKEAMTRLAEENKQLRRRLDKPE